jgi:hypothetical protein
MSDEKQKPEGWTHAPMIVGWNNDGSLQTVDSWNVKPTLTDEEKDAVMLAYHQMRIIHADNAAAMLRGLLERLK